MRTLFSELSIGGLRLPHRIVVSPMCQYVAHDSVAGDWHLQHLMQLAFSSAGPITRAVGGIAEPAQADQVALAWPFLADPPPYRRAAGLRKPPVAA